MIFVAYPNKSNCYELVFISPKETNKNITMKSAIPYDLPRR